MSERVTFKSKGGGDVAGALAIPAGSGQVPGVVVLQEYWGLTDHIKSIADRLAEERFVALAPDLYHGKLTKDAAEAGQLMKELDWAVAMQDIAGAVEELKSNARVNGKVGVIGFCMGGALAFAAACNLEDLGAVVSFYGIPPQADWSKVEAPILAHCAKKDDWVTPEAAQGVEQALKDAGKSIEVRYYDADHAFFNDTRPEVFSEECASEAWMRTVAFLKRQMTSS
jgi:carboxymethylenebutenolidase